MDRPDVETYDLPGDDAPQGFVYYSDKEDVTTILFYMSSLPKGISKYYIFPEETNVFNPKEVKNVVSAINIQT